MSKPKNLLSLPSDAFITSESQSNPATIPTQSPNLPHSSTPTSPHEFIEKSLPNPLFQSPNSSKQITATLTPPVGQFWVNFSLQLIAIVAAIAFGIFAVKSVNVGIEANGLASLSNRYAVGAIDAARTANQLALVAVCMALRFEGETQVQVR